MKSRLEIVHEDQQIIAVNKAPGMLSIPDRYKPELVNLKDLLHKEYGDIYVVHRLDKPTSGVMLFARTLEAHKHINDQFANGKIKKHYLGIVHGSPQPPSGEIDKAIAPHPSKAGTMQLYAQGKPALTHYEVREGFRYYALMSLFPKTGRTHQLRVHLESIGHPLLADAVYGREDKWFLSSLKKKRYNPNRDSREERPLLSRAALHAYEITFFHPEVQEMTLKADMPKDMRATLSQLRKWDNLSLDNY